MIIWRWVGYNAIIFLAGLQAIPADVHEAARIDGAGPVQTFFRVTLPLLRPVLLFSVVMSAINGMQVFAEAAGAGRRARWRRRTPEPRWSSTSTTWPSASNDFGYGAAIAWGIFVVVVIFAVINWRLIQRPERAEVSR